MKNSIILTLLSFKAIFFYWIVLFMHIYAHAVFLYFVFSLDIRVETVNFVNYTIMLKRFVKFFWTLKAFTHCKNSYFVLPVFSWRIFSWSVPTNASNGLGKKKTELQVLVKFFWLAGKMQCKKPDSFIWNVSGSYKKHRL